MRVYVLYIYIYMHMYARVLRRYLSNDFFLRGRHIDYHWISTIVQPHVVRTMPTLDPLACASDA